MNNLYGIKKSFKKIFILFTVDYLCFNFKIRFCSYSLWGSKRFCLTAAYFLISMHATDTTLPTFLKI